MREVKNKGKTGIQWTQTTQLHDLDYANQDQQPGTDRGEHWPQGRQRENQSHTS